MNARFNELRVSNDVLNDPPELRRRMNAEGYLFFKRLHNVDQLRELRLRMMTRIQNGGWLLPDTDPMDGIADPSKACTEGDLEYTDVYHDVYKLEAFHRSAHWPEVMDVIEKIVGGPALPHPQKVARLWFPQFTQHTTPAHQDFVHFQGNFETYTAWSPVGDCPIELGGLAVLPGSHKVGRVLNHRFSLGAGQLKLTGEDETGDWTTTDYEIGDALIFPALTVHRALPNLTEDRLRLSLDNRYQAKEATISEHVLTPHLDSYNPLTWEEVYADWESDDLKYYWKGAGATVIPKDNRYAQKGFQDAVELAKQGDKGAQLHLRRAVLKDPNSEDGKAARAVLEQIGVEI